MEISVVELMDPRADESLVDAIELEELSTDGDALVVDSEVLELEAMDVTGSEELVTDREVLVSGVKVADSDVVAAELEITDSEVVAARLVDMVVDSDNSEAEVTDSDDDVVLSELDVGASGVEVDVSSVVVDG